MTRKDYMDGRVTHAEYYTSVAKAAGVSFADSQMLPKVRDALEKGDEHLNTISLTTWDAMALFPTCRANISRALKAHEDFWSLAGGVCTLKQAAKNAVLNTHTQEETPNDNQHTQ